MPRISVSMRSSMALRFSARRSISSPLRPTTRRSDRLPAIMRCVVPVMASILRNTRRATKTPPRMPSAMTAKIDQRLARGDNAQQTLTLLKIATDQHAHAGRQFEDTNERAVILPVLTFEPVIAGFPTSQAGSWCRPGSRRHCRPAPVLLSRRPCRDWRRGAANGSRPRAAPTDAAALELFIELGDFGVDGRGDLLVDEALRVPGEVAEQRSREQRKEKQIDQRQAKRRGAKDFTEGRHGPCILRRAPYAEAAC